jgi:uncharacterized membrane protein
MDSAQPGMNAAQQFVVVKAPLERVYEQWSRIEDLPKFIPPLRGVRRIDDTHFSYVWHPNGEGKQGIFQIVLQIPGRRIAWRARRLEEYLGNFKRLVENEEAIA